MAGGHDVTWPRRPAPISDYGLLGDTRTAALVAADGGMDWLCLPRFDGEPLFGRLVGGPDAGTFRLGPAGPATVVERRYRQHTATLTTTWAVGSSRLTLTEAMVAEVSGRLLPTTLIVRRLSAEGQRRTPSSSSTPASAYGTAGPECTAGAGHCCVTGGRSRSLWSPHPTSPSSRADLPRSWSGQADRSPSYWPWPTVSR